MHDFATIADDVDVYCVDRILIGERTTISQYTYLCGATHDFEDIRFPLRPMPITIGAHVWVAADCFVAPGVTISDGAVVGARSGVFADCQPWTIHAGTPARPLRSRNHPLNPSRSGDRAGVSS
jgi:putative colanic acid biosynthesis acetyltransferase WcaF